MEQTTPYYLMTQDMPKLMLCYNFSSNLF